MKSSELISKELCGAISSFEGLDDKKGGNYYNGIILKELFINNDIYNITGAKVDKLFDKIMDKSLFGIDTSINLNKSLLRNRLIRYSDYQSSFISNEKVLKKAGESTIKVKGNDITINYHFIIKNDKTNTIEVYKVKNKKCDLKKNGRSKETKIAENMELYLLQLAGESLYPTEKVCGSIVFLPSVSDTSGKVDGEFNTNKCVNIVKNHFNAIDSDQMNKRIIETLDDHTLHGSKCNTSYCDTCKLNNICNYRHKDISKLAIIPPKAKASGKVIFSPSQQNIIDVKKGIYRFLSVAGSGKTTVIANRYTQLIQDRVNPSDILLVTYTNKGAIEMKEKIAYWLKERGLSVPKDKLNIFTFNSFGYELIKKEFKRFGFTKAPEVIDRLTKVEFIKSILDNHTELSFLNYVYPFMSLYNAKGAVIELGEMFNVIKNQSFIYPSELQEYYEKKNISDDEALEVIKMSKEYNKILKDNNLVEFDDQILFAYELFNDKDMLKKYGYSHIMVDEFQDSDSVQMNLISLLASYPFFVSLCVCGDDSQSIYSWRGAEQSNILNFHEYFKNVKDIKLLENFRSTNEICEFANNLDSINKYSTRKKLSSSNHGDKPRLYTNDLEHIARKVAHDISSGYKPHQIAIITRNKNALIDVQNYLDNLDIPSIIAVSEELIDNPKVKNIIGFSNFLLDNTLDLHFAEYLQIAKNEEFKKATDIASFVKKEKSEFLDEYLKYSSDCDKLNYIYTLLEAIAKEDNAVSKLIEVCKDKEITTIKEFNEFLNKLELYKADYYIEKSEKEYEAVILTTAHSSKGREFDKVFVFLDKFKYPKVSSYVQDKNNPEVEEERRLLFVAVTRAKKELEIISTSDTSSIYKEIEECLNKK